MKPWDRELDLFGRRVMDALIESTGWPRTPHEGPMVGWWWILDRLGDHLEDPR